MELSLAIAGLLAGNVRHALEADLVFAGWVDADKPHGIDFLLLKGEHLIYDETLDMGGVTSIAAIRVGDEVEAMELQQQVRDAGNGGI